MKEIYKIYISEIYKILDRGCGWHYEELYSE